MKSSQTSKYAFLSSFISCLRHRLIKGEVKLIKMFWFLLYFLLLNICCRLWYESKVVNYYYFYYISFVCIVMGPSKNHSMIFSVIFYMPLTRLFEKTYRHGYKTQNRVSHMAIGVLDMWHMRMWWSRSYVNFLFYQNKLKYTKS